VPGSLLEVASTLALCLALRAACNRAAGALPGPPSSGGQRAAAAGVAAPVASGAGGGLEGQSGVKYDGYAAAIASAAEGGEGEGGGGLTMMNQRSEAALEQIRRGLVRVAAPFSHLDMPGSMGHGGGGTRGHGHVRHRHRPGHDGKAHSGERGRRQHRAGSEPPTTPPSGGGGGGGGGGGLGLAAAAGAGAAAPASPGAISPFSTRSPSPRGRGRSRLGSPAVRPSSVSARAWYSRSSLPGSLAPRRLPMRPPHGVPFPPSPPRPLFILLFPFFAARRPQPHPRAAPLRRGLPGSRPAARRARPRRGGRGVRERAAAAVPRVGALLAG
jgi:hypothetical protein